MESSAATHTDTLSRLDFPPAPATIGRDLTIVPAPEESVRARERTSVLARSLAFSDLLVSIVTCGVVALATGVAPAGSLALAATAGVALPFCMFAMGVYTVDELRAWASGVAEAPKSLVGALLFSWPIFGAAWFAGAPSAGFTAAAATIVTLGATTSARGAVRAMLHRAKPLRQRTVIVGSGVVASQLFEKLSVHSQFGLVPVGLLDDDPHPNSSMNLPRLGSLGELPALLARGEADRVIIAFSRAGHDELLSCIRTCRDFEVSVDVVPRLFEFLDGARSLDNVGGLPLLSLGKPRFTRSSRVSKRGLDIVGATLLLALLLPTLVAIALAVKLTSRGPVLFRQPRVGAGGRTFNLIKFRSMYRDAEARKEELVELNDNPDGVMFKIRQDPRITAVGRWLRRFSLDELPQLINVVKGEMSLVGPRPLIPQESAALAEDWHARRLALRPGITGVWQVQGRSESPFDEMVRLDYQYVAGWSLARDVEILLATLPAVVSGRGAY